MSGMRIVMVGLAMLWVTFFLPHAVGCSEVMSPVGVVRDADGWLMSLACVFALFPFALAFLSLPLLVIRELVRNDRGRRVLAKAIVFLCVAVLLIVGVFGMVDAVRTLPESWRPQAYMNLAICGLALVGGYIPLRTPTRARLPSCFVAWGFLGVVFFAQFLVFFWTSVLYGLLLSTAACGLVFAGGLIETIVALRRSRSDAPTDTLPTSP